MYSPAAFRETDHERMVATIEACGLALLITQGSAGIRANHLPLLLTRERDSITLHGHLARANPQCEDLAVGGPVLVVFSGPDAYISPGLYPSKIDNPAVVPTWNYISVQARGTPQVFHDPERLHALVKALTERHEAARPTPWAIEDAPRDYLQGMLKAIVGFSIPVDDLQGKRKLSQNRSNEDRRGVSEGLAASPQFRARELAASMTDSDSYTTLRKQP